MRPSPLPLALAVCLLVPSADARAQSLSSLINDLFTYGECGLPLCLDVDNAHGEHFIPALTQGNQTVLGFLTQSIGRSTANLPISATSSGSTFRIVDGLPVRTSSSAGPIFAERAQTLGRGRFFVGANVSGIAFQSLNGAQTSDLRFNFGHQDVGAPGLGDPLLENDIISTQIALEVSQQVAAVFATWGVLDFVDIGVAIPLLRTSIQGVSTGQVTPFGPVAVHRFGGDSANPILQTSKVVSGTASGIGDVAARLKVNLGQSETFGVALMTDVRLPTGREEDFLGTGSTSIRALGIVGGQFGNFAPHFNAGYVARTDTLQNDAIVGTLGFDALVTNWATVAADVISEWQLGVNRVTLPGTIEYVTPFARSYPATSIPNKRQNILNMSMGAKFTVRGGTVIVLNAIVPINKVGLQPGVAWTAGLEYTF
ncbi:MAG TPA: hypothetical protein VGA02_04775 [Gemmatimonadales bacterium]|jgi:hypothetical protein